MFYNTFSFCDYKILSFPLYRTKDLKETLEAEVKYLISGHGKCMFYMT